MSLVFRPMRAHEAAAVADMVRRLAADTGHNTVPKLTGDGLAKASDLIAVTVAEEGGKLLGACLTLDTYSTWRNARGLYVVDLFVDGQARSRGLGRALLAHVARAGLARGLSFIKLEVDHGNAAALRFYTRLGFIHKTDDQLLVLEQRDLEAFSAKA